MGLYIATEYIRDRQVFENSYMGLYMAISGTDKYLKPSIWGYIWDRQVFKNSYMGLYRAISGTDKYLKTHIWGCTGQYLGQTKI